MRDDLTGDTGSLTNWSLNITTTPTYTENGAAVAVAPNLTVSDVEGQIASATVRLTSTQAGDVLAANVTGTPITQTYNAANGTLLLSGTATTTQYQQVIDSIQFSSTSNNPGAFGLSPIRTLEYQVNDGAALTGPLLGPKADFGVPGPTRAVATADLNGDGKLDLVAGVGANVYVLRGNGDGTFQAATSTFTLDANATDIAIADLNGDGKLDLAVTNGFNAIRNVSVMLGNGDGTFSGVSNFGVGGSPLSVAIADVNGDGKLDLAVANSGASNVSVLLGDGSGVFSAAANFATGSSSRSVAIADVNGDGKLDLAVANQGGNVSTLLGDGSGGFSAATNFTAGTAVYVAISDVNGDGMLDLAVANIGGNVSVLLGDGNGGFAAAKNFTAGTQPYSVAISDVNGDGELDLAVVNAGGNVSVLLGDGNGSFAAATNFNVGAGPVSIAIGDFNGSGGLDLAVANNNVASNSVSVLLNASTNLSGVQQAKITVAAVNDAPTGAVTLSGTATQGQTLTATNTLADAEGLGNISYQWRANGTAIGGATANTFTLTEAQVGTAITVTASYTDKLGANEAVTSSATGAVANVNDAPTGGLAISGTATQGQTLTATNTLADLDGLGTIIYQWSANGTPIVGATANTFTLTETQVGKNITVTANYVDGHGTPETIASGATGAVANVNDAPTGTVGISGVAFLGQTLTATNTLADIDGLGTISYQWSAAGVAINGATASTYTLTASEIGKAINVTASYTDGRGTAESIAATATAAVQGPTQTGGSNNDTLTGTTGADIMAAGAGDDTYIVDNAGDVTLENINEGNDTVQASLTWVLGANVENLQLTGSAVSGTGNELPNTITGNSANNPLLRGGGGADTITGGDGDDWLEGETGNDIFTGIAGGDSLNGENGSDTILGGAGDDVMFGGAGIDFLIGETGNDLAYGGSEFDAIDGRQGSDVLYGEDGDDIIFGDGYFYLFGFSNDSLFGGPGNDIMMGEAGEASLNGAGDALHGEDGNDILDGGAGDDAIYGGNGNDVIDGDNGNDYIVGGPGAEIILGSNAVAYGGATVGSDLFVYNTMADAGDSIYGFDTRLNIGENDGIDLRSLFASLGYSGNTPRAEGTNLLQVTQSGADTLVQIDPDGAPGPQGFTTLVTLVGVTSTTITDSFFLF